MTSKRFRKNRVQIINNCSEIGAVELVGHPLTVMAKGLVMASLTHDVRRREGKTRYIASN